MKKLLLACMMALGIGASAQVGPPASANPNTVPQGYGFTQSSGTYTPLSASRTIWQSGAALGTDAASAAITIPSFKFNGKTYTTLYISNNGFITFGTAPLAATYTGLSTDSAVANLAEGAVAGFAANLVNANTTTSEIAYETVGTKFSVQFTDLKVSGGAAAQLLNFQIQLDSSNNTVAIVYGTCASGTATATGQVGLRGSESSDQNNRTGTNWTATTVGTTTTSNCTLGTTNSTTVPASGLTFTYTPGTWVSSPPAYATLPYTNDFSTWTNGNSTADLPGANWRTWPARGDNSWRQSDIATSGFTTASGWTSTTGGAAIAAPAVAPTARFHSYNCVNASGYMDLYVDLSTGGAGNRIVSFDYINTSGTDVLNVLLSTDGGATFTSMGPAQAVSASWASKSYITTSTSATAVIRFMGTGDNGSTDIQIDNLSITVSTSPPACTAIVAPANAATGISLTPTISWNTSSLASSYLINIGTTPGGTDIQNGLNVGNVTSYTIGTGSTPASNPLSFNTQYYITIIPTNTYGNATGCTETSFTTTATIPCPTVTAPATGATGLTFTPTITWNAVTGVTGYTLTVGTTAGGTDILNAQSVTGTSYTFATALNPNTKYYYTVNAVTATSSSASCTERNFTTQCAAITAPWTENFDGLTTVGSAVLPSCWATNGGTNFASATASGNTYNDPKSAPNYVTIYYPTTASYLWTPLTTLTANQSYDFSFYWVGDGLAGWQNEVLVNNIQAATGATSLTTFITPTQTTTGGGNSTNYTKVTVTFVPTATGNYTFGIKGYVTTTAPYYMGFDDFSLKITPTCVEPTFPATPISGLTASGATVTWNASSPAPASNYDIYYSTTNTAPTSASTPNATNVTSPYTLTGLNANTTYYVWVRSHCSSTDQSTWAGPVTVYTGYCVPSSTSQASWISAFTSTGASQDMNYSAATAATGTNGYQDLTASTNKIISATTGTAIPVTLTAGGPTVGIAVWIDWNNNLIFEASERMYVTSTYTTTTTGATITPPAGQANGSYRMRVLVDYNNSAPSNPCGSITRGEYVDYIFQIDTTLGTSEIVNNSKEIKVYPNPFTDIVNISDIKDVKNVTVVDMAGRVVKAIANPVRELQLGDLKSGMYILKIDYKNGTSKSVKAIKK